MCVAEHRGFRCTGRAAGEELNRDRIGIVFDRMNRRHLPGRLTQQRLAVGQLRVCRQAQALELRRRSDDERLIESPEQ